METRRLGKTDMEVSILGFGGAEIGLEGPGASLETVTRLLNAALDEGLNLIDTGECYGSSEEIIGRSVSGRRQDYHLFTKCGHPDGMPGRTGGRIHCCGASSAACGDCGPIAWT